LENAAALRGKPRYGFFERKPDAGWIPVRVKKTRQNWNLALWLIQSEAKKR
jgi:hypothetical protein